MLSIGSKRLEPEPGFETYGLTLSLGSKPLSLKFHDK
jgi:hypothetical protein